MSLLEFTGRLVVAVLLLLLVTAALCLDRVQLERTRRELRPRLRSVAPHLGLLGLILAVNKVAREAALTISWVFDANISGLIYALEGELVVAVQSVQQPALTAYFSFMYLAGYIALLVFPFVAYLSLDERLVKQTAVAYAVNYGLGLLCYVLLVSYGPRNVIPDVVNQPLYTTYPDAQVLTGQLNANTNVFPSLHASLAITVALLAVRTRDAYPRWALLAVPAAASVVVATVYLGIHWVTDVVAGAALAALSVWLATRRWEVHLPDPEDPAPGTT